MKNEPWEAIYTVFETMRSIRDRLAPSGEGNGQEQKNLSSVGKDELIDIRADIRKQLDLLRVKLLEQLSERDCYLAIFPIVALFDEMIQVRVLKEEGILSWPPLQQELFQIDDAGEVFFETLDDMLRKPQTLPFCHEVFYFCLSYGFQGKHIDNPARINEYMEKLREKIPVDRMKGPTAQPDVKSRSLLRRPMSFLWNYAAVAAILTAVFFLLYGSFNYWRLSLVSFN